MKASAGCDDTDILCIAEELADRWESAAIETVVTGLEEGRDCLPCLLDDWDPDFED